MVHKIHTELQRGSKCPLFEQRCSWCSWSTAVLQNHLFKNYYFSLRYFLKVRPVEAAAEGWAAGDSFARYKMVQKNSSSHHNMCTQRCPKGWASLPVWIQVQFPIFQGSWMLKKLNATNIFFWLLFFVDFFKHAFSLSPTFLTHATFDTLRCQSMINKPKTVIWQILLALTFVTSAFTEVEKQVKKEQLNPFQFIESKIHFGGGRSLIAHC